MPQEQLTAPPSPPGRFNSTQIPASVSEPRVSIGRFPLTNSALHAQSVLNHHPHVPKPSVSTTPSEAEEGQTDTRPRRRANVFALWKWELLCLVTSILSFVAIIITLRIYQNRVVSSSTWRLPVSINAIIAILSALFKGCLAMPATEGISQLKWIWFSRKARSLEDLDLYDKASRSAWGAVTMIFRQFRRDSKSPLASLGAVIVLIALIVDPFSQASVSLKPCWQEADHDASIPRANNYTKWGGHNGVGANLDAGMSLAAYIGTLKPPANSSVSVPVSCATNNCTFPSDQGATFNSVGICTLSWDISEQIKTLEVVRNPGKGWNYSLPWGNQLQPGDLLSSNSMAVPGTSFAAEGEGPWNRTSLVDVEFLGMKFKDPKCDTSNCTFDAPINLMPVAYMFSLIPCVQTWAANFTDGVYHETLVNEQYLHWVVPKSKGYQLALNRTLHNGKWQDCIGTRNATDTNTIEVYPLPKSRDPSQKQAAPSTWYQPQCVYGMGFGASGGLADFIGPNGFFYSKGKLTYATETILYGSLWLENVWNKGNMTLESVTAFAHGLALSITAEMRTNPTGPVELSVHRGTTMQKETCIVVEWKYLSFLATVLVLEVIFFISVMAVNHKSSWYADWKSSTLAVAFQNVGSTTTKEGAPPELELDKDLHEAAKRITVSFADVDGKWQLRKASGYAPIPSREGLHPGDGGQPE